MHMCYSVDTYFCFVPLRHRWATNCESEHTHPLSTVCSHCCPEKIASWQLFNLPFMSMLWVLSSHSSFVCALLRHKLSTSHCSIFRILPIQDKKCVLSMWATMALDTVGARQAQTNCSYVHLYVQKTLLTTYSRVDSLQPSLSIDSALFDMNLDQPGISIDRALCWLCLPSRHAA